MASTDASTALSQVKHIVLVLSGKGGVGKSTVACQLAMALAHQQNQQVGLLDVDICGPSVPKICGLENRDVLRDAHGWEPVNLVDDPEERKRKNVKVMSIAYLLPSDRDAVVWRGPRKDAMIKQFIGEVNWGPLDYLIIDTPPGTSDEHLTLCEVLKDYAPAGAVVVTTPQDVSTDDVKKELSFCHRLGIRCLGIVENMSGFVCPHCAHCTDIFSRGGGQKLAQLYEVPFLGSIPIDPMLSLAEDQGKMFAPPESANEEDITLAQTASAVNAVINAIVAQVERADGEPAPAQASYVPI